MIDIYCERVDFSFWSEPVNALTNIGFVLAGLLAFRMITSQEAAPLHLRLLAAFMIVIGIGSFLFHTLASRSAMLADVIPIYVFQIVFLWSFPRYALGLPASKTLILIAIYIGSVLATRILPWNINGSEMYLPTIAVLILFSVAYQRIHGHLNHPLLLASVIFTVSLTLRTIDDLVCSAWPLGTHFLWHLLNSGVLFLSWYSLYSHERSGYASV